MKIFNKYAHVHIKHYSYCILYHNYNILQLYTYSADSITRNVSNTRATRVGLNLLHNSAQKHERTWMYILLISLRYKVILVFQPELSLKTCF